MIFHPVFIEAMSFLDWKENDFLVYFFLLTSWKDWKSQSEIPSGGYSCQPAPINKVIEIWICKFNSWIEISFRWAGWIEVHLSSWEVYSEKFKTYYFVKNKFALGYICAGFCVLVDCELSKCSAVWQQMVSSFYKQVAEAAFLEWIVIKAAAVRDERAVSR